MLMVPSARGFLSALSVGWDPANISSSITLSNNNKTATANSNSGSTVARGFGQNSGKRYFELIVGGNSLGDQYFGICNGSFAVVSGNTVGGDTNSIAMTEYAGAYSEAYNGSIGSAVFGTAQVVGDVIMVAADLTGGQVFLGVNGVWVNGSGPGTTSGDWRPGGATRLYPAVSFYSVSTIYGGATLNTGDTTFAYPLPSGYTAWG